MQLSSSWRSVLLALLLFALVSPGSADEFSAVEYERQTIYHSPQTPGYTCWVGAWIMPDGDLMTCFTQATGPVEGRPKAPTEVMELLSWYPQYDMTGLDLHNVHLRSSDAGKTWEKVSADPFKTCMNGVTGEAQSALPDGTIVRGVFGLYLPFDKDLPKTGFLQRSTDGTNASRRPSALTVGSLAAPRRQTHTSGIQQSPRADNPDFVRPGADLEQATAGRARRSNRRLHRGIRRSGTR